MINLKKDLETIQLIHGVQNRKWDKEVPYWVHPMWCATMILSEWMLDEEFRHRGARALMYHDAIEAGFQHYVPYGVIDLVEGMTFSGFDEELTELWGRPKEVRLLKLYDKVSNVLDGHWMCKDREQQYRRHTEKLLIDVICHYGDLQICQIANALL